MRTLKFGLSALALASALLPATAGAFDFDRDYWWGLGGVWKVRLAPKDCTTGNLLPAPPIQTLFTFHADGTLTGSLQNYAISATNRTPSHGLWKPVFDGRRGEFVMKFIHLRYDFASGIFLGTQEANSQVTLDRSGASFTASSTSKGFDANGNNIYTSCANLSGERVTLP